VKGFLHSGLIYAGGVRAFTVCSLSLQRDVESIVADAEQGFDPTVNAEGGSR
jgi:hypothetical protein